MSTVAAQITVVKGRDYGYSCIIETYVIELASLSGSKKGFDTREQARAWGENAIVEAIQSVGLKADIKVGVDRDEKFFAKVFA